MQTVADGELEILRHAFEKERKERQFFVGGDFRMHGFELGDVRSFLMEGTHKGGSLFKAYEGDA